MLRLQASRLHSSFTRLPLRRCTHDVPPRPQLRSLNGRWRAGLGLSAVAAAYFAWRWTADGQRETLDGKPSTTTGNHSRMYESPSENSSKNLRPQQATSDPDPILPPSPKNLSDDTKDKKDGTVVATPEQTAPAPSESTESNPSDTQEVSPDQPVQIEEGSAPEEEADEADGEQGENGDAFNPVTGEINWDCPCLGGMAHGTCGPEFKEAFSCFVFSEDEPKGINCVEKFKAMQDCFREHPDEYADEIMRDDDDEEGVDLEDGPTAVPSNDDDVALGGEDTPHLSEPPKNSDSGELKDDQ